MAYQDFLRSEIINTIPKRKFDHIIEQINASKDELKIKNIKLLAANRYYESNIPIEYWNLSMSKDFKGNNKLLNEFTNYVSNITENYYNGTSLLFAGSHGLGKTMTVTCILKKAVEKDYNALYTNLSDIVNVLISSSGSEKTIAFRELKMVDFLVIDEFDSRFIQSDKAADLYAQTLEGIFRARIQNKLPTLMCTNSPNILESFHGPLKDSIESLTTGYLKTVVVMGEDFRSL